MVMNDLVCFCYCVYCKVVSLMCLTTIVIITGSQPEGELSQATAQNVTCTTPSRSYSYSYSSTYYI